MGHGWPILRVKTYIRFLNYLIVWIVTNDFSALECQIVLHVVCVPFRNVRQKFSNPLSYLGVNWTIFEEAYQANAVLKQECLKMFGLLLKNEFHHRRLRYTSQRVPMYKSQTIKIIRWYTPMEWPCIPIVPYFLISLRYLTTATPSSLFRSGDGAPSLLQ